MKLILVGLTFALLCFAKDYHNSTHVYTPQGLIPAECHYEVPSGTHIQELEDGTTELQYPNGYRHIMRPCPGRISKEEQENARAYNGWLAFTSYKNADFDSFLGDFSVPNNPKSSPQVLYIFTGLQNVDWIPIVDPQPKVFDIIQPVLQYPGGRTGEWAAKSWYVALSGGSVSSKAIPFSSGQTCFGNMTRIGSQRWFVDSVNTHSQQHTHITVDKPRLLHQPWAYNTLECYGCNGCSEMPTEPCHFTKLDLKYKGASVTPKWTVRKSPNLKCHELAVVKSATAVDIYFDHS